MASSRTMSHLQSVLVVWAQCLLAPSERAAKERFCLEKSVLFAQQHRDVVQQCQGRRVVGPEHLLEASQSPAIQGLGLVQLSLLR